MEEKSLTLEQLSAIREKAAALKSEKKLRKICPMVVFGDKECEEKEFYVAYMAEPTFPQFSKFMAASKKDEVTAMRTLARDCFIDGDKELVDNDSLFLFGLMGQLSELIQTRQSILVTDRRGGGAGRTANPSAFDIHTPLLPRGRSGRHERRGVRLALRGGSLAARAVYGPQFRTGTLRAARRLIHVS